MESSFSSDEEDGDSLSSVVRLEPQMISTSQSVFVVRDQEVALACSVVKLIEFRIKTQVA